MPAVLLASAACFGTTGAAQAYGPDSAGSVAVGLMRVVVGLLLVLVVRWWAARGGTWAVDRHALASRPVPVLIGGLAVLAYQPAFFAGVHLNGSLDAGTSTVGVAGVLASLGAALSYAVHTVVAKDLMTHGVAATTAIGVLFGIAMVLGAPVLLLVDLDWVGSVEGLSMIVWLGFVTVVLTYVLFALGLRQLSASTVSTLTLAEPLTACALGLMLLDERLTAVGWCGVAMLLVSVLLSAVAGITRPATDRASRRR